MFVVINLFIAVVINNLEAAKGDVASDAPDDDLVRRAAVLREQAAELERLARRKWLVSTAPDAPRQAG